MGFRGINVDQLMSSSLQMEEIRAILFWHLQSAWNLFLWVCLCVLLCSRSTEELSRKTVHHVNYFLVYFFLSNCRTFSECVTSSTATPDFCLHWRHCKSWIGRRLLSTSFWSQMLHISTTVLPKEKIPAVTSITMKYRQPGTALGMTSTVSEWVEVVLDFYFEMHQNVSWNIPKSVYAGLPETSAVN